MLRTSIAESQRLCLRFGPDDSRATSVALPVLAGNGVEDLFPQARPLPHPGAFALFEQDGWLLGRASGPARDRLESSAHDLYRALLGCLGGHHLARIWNYVPGINEASADALENYRVFCRGRSLAFEGVFGPAFKSHAPAASAVGTDGDALVIAFAAHREAARHIENPHQVPAYDYPAEHGPRAPTFARASGVALGTGEQAVFISGTAAIRGHGTVAPGDTAAQLACTIENLREISLACGLGPDLAAERRARRHFKVYVRHGDDLETVRAGLERTLIRPEDQVSFLRSDICRRELNVEIEVSLPRVAAR